jgi:uncharacterized protein
MSRPLCPKAITRFSIAATQTVLLILSSFFILTGKFARFACFALALLAGGNAFAQETVKREPLTLVTTTGEYKFDVEIAATRAEQARGLMYRRSMDPAQGMLFTYPEAQYVSMWMRNTYISLDMVFILPDGRVHRVERMTEPHSERIIESGERIGAVLELLAGTADRINLKPGDKVLHPLFKTAPK